MLDDLMNIVVVVHVSCGAVALLTASLAVVSKKGQRWHQRFGQIFTAAMVVIFLTALVIALTNPNLFLILVAIFSVYLAVSGYLIARNRLSQATRMQWVISVIAIITGVVMLFMGIAMLISDNGFGAVMLVFGSIILGFSVEEIWRYSQQRMTGTTRIAAHLSRMLGAAIAILTASTVVNLDIEPAWLMWLLPTVLLVPVIVYWNIVLARRGDV